MVLSWITFYNPAMPVFHFTLHAYRSWHEDDPRGYVQRGEEGVQPPNPKLAAHRDQLAKQSEVRFTKEQMLLLLDGVRTTCERKGWLAYAAAATCTHVHAVISWTEERTADQVQAGLKSGLGFCLSLDRGRRATVGSAGAGHRCVCRIMPTFST